MVIFYDEERNLWNFSKAGSQITGSSNSSKISYLLGKHNWTIENDTYECGLGKDYQKVLKLTSCQDGQFTCDSGQCIEMRNRCDQLFQCRDESDEKNCKLLVLREGYNKKIPPVTDNMSTGSVPIEVSITLLKIVNIEEVKHSIEIQFQIEMDWYESRASYNNLKERATG